MAELEEKKEALSKDEKAAEKAKAKEAAKEEKKKNKVPLKERVGKFLREYKSELKKIVWYSREQTFKSSVVVVVSIIITGAVVGGLDWCFSHLITWLGTLI